MFMDIRYLPNILGEISAGPLQNTHLATVMVVMVVVVVVVVDL
jgi:hypothetical protein